MASDRAVAPTAIERVFLRSEPGVRRSLTIQSEVHIDLAATRSDVVDAVARLQAAHPFCRARWDEGSVMWHVPAPGSDARSDAAATVIDGSPEGGPGTLLAIDPDDHRRPLLRLHHEVAEGGARLVVAAHHALMDGMGVLRFVADLLALLGGDEDLVRRPAQRSAGSRAPAASGDTGSGRPRPRRPITLPGCATPTGPPLWTWSTAELPQPAVGSRRSAGSVLAALHLALAQWIARWGEASDHLGIAVPVSLRPLAITDERYRNACVMVSSTSDAERRARPGDLGAELARQLAPMRRGRWSPTLAPVAAAVEEGRGLPARMYLPFFDSAVVSPITSIPIRSPIGGSWPLIRYATMPSNNPGSALGLFVLDWRGQRRATVRYDRSRHVPEQVDDLLRTLAESLTVVERPPRRG